jgi:hypothetical protein
VRRRACQVRYELKECVSLLVERYYKGLIPRVDVSPDRSQSIIHEEVNRLIGRVKNLEAVEPQYHQGPPSEDVSSVLFDVTTNTVFVARF